MSAQREALVQFVRLIEGGNSLDAMRQFYSPEVVVFENRELARAGVGACLAYEQKALAALSEPLHAKALSLALDEQSGTSFVEWLIRFTGNDGRPMRLEQVAVQKWERGRIVQERFYYEGLVDEGD